MKHLVLLSSVYALIVVLVLPGSLLASEEPSPGTAEGGAAGDVSAEASPDPAAAHTAPPEAAAADPAPPPDPAPQAETPPGEPAPADEPPAVQDLGDERDLDRPVARAAASATVTISDFDYSPGQVTINQGDTVTWVNEGPTPHSATASDGSFDTGIYGAGQSRSHTFDQAGSFAYICTPHPYMRGTVVVQAAQSGGGSEGGGSGSGSSGSGSGTTDDGAAATGTDTGPTLPNSGADAWVLFLLGAMMLALGALVQHRSRQPHG